MKNFKGTGSPLDAFISMNIREVESSFVPEPEAGDSCDHEGLV